MYKDVLPYRDKFNGPGVEVHCLHGYGVNTTEKLMYKPGDFPQNYPILVKGDGDGTVNRRSLESCNYWQNSQKQKVHHQAFLHIDHMSILKDVNVINYILQIVKAG